MAKIKEALETVGKIVTIEDIKKGYTVMFKK